MTKARIEQVSLDDTPWYHVVNRCVRRAFLCGVDAISGQSYEHRREWIETRILQLANVFSIDVAAYAVMSNHYHVVVRIDQERAQQMSRDEVLLRWTQLFAGNPIVQQYLALEDEPASDSLLKAVDEFVEIYRQRLFDLSWFMRVLNESIARMANKEDGVKGHFWEGRFKSQALLDEQAILSVMAYVDLNPIRANMANGLTDSEYTSVFKRLQESGLVKDKQTDSVNEVVKTDRLADENFINNGFTRPRKTDNPFKNKLSFKPEALLSKLPLAQLMPFDRAEQCNTAIPFSQSDYIEFVVYLGRAVHPNKQGSISDKMPVIMKKLGLNAKMLDIMGTGLLKRFGSAIGRETSLNRLKKGRNKCFLQGMKAARLAYS